MPLILPADFRAPLIIPGRRHRKVHWNRERSRAIAALGKYEREDWHRGLTWPQGLFGLAEKYFAKKNNPGCACCGTACCNEDPAQFQVDIGTVTDGTCADCDTYLSGQSFVVDHYADCNWRYFFPDGVLCAGAGLRSILEVSINSFLLDKIHVNVTRPVTPLERSLRWQLDVDPFDWPLDCPAISVLDIPFLSSTGYCNGTPTCTLTAL